MNLDEQVKKLSARAKVLLLFVDEYTEYDWETKKLKRYCIADRRRYGHYVSFQKDEINISGGGDAKIFASLINKQLIKMIGIAIYSYAVTEQGRRIAERILELEYYDETGHIVRK